MRVNIWIREEDEELWKAIDNRSEFIHEALNRKMEVVTRFERGKPDEVTIDGKNISVSQAKEVIDEVSTADPATYATVPLPEVPDRVVVQSTPKGPNEFVKLAQADKPMDFCKHDAVKGFCKKGCK